MKKKCMLVLKIVVTLFLVWNVCDFLDVKTDEAKSGDFYEKPEAYDVIFTGSSHTVMGVLPMELWDKYQITSYNLANYGQTLAVDYWVLKDALEICVPKLVVVEVCSTGLDYKYRDTHGVYLHETFDAMKLSGTKINAINDLFEGELHEEFLFPMTLYHSRWESMDDSFFSSEESTYQRGADVNALIGAKTDILTKYIEPMELLSCDDMNVSDTISKVYLEKIISLCQEKDVEILLMVTPYVANEEEQRWINSVYNISERYDVGFYNGLYENVINTYTDMWDIGHMNASGAKKWTDCLGQYIVDNYNIGGACSEADSGWWNFDYEKYVDYKEDVLREEQVLENYLMLLKDEDMSAAIYMKTSPVMYADEHISELMNNLMENGELDRINEAYENSEDYFVLLERNSGRHVEVVGNEKLQGFDTTAGEVTYLADSNGQHYINIETAENYLLEMADGVWYPDVQIVVWNSATGEIVDVAEFYVQPKDTELVVTRMK